MTRSLYALAIAVTAVASGHGAAAAKPAKLPPPKTVEPPKAEPVPPMTQPPKAGEVTKAGGAGKVDSPKPSPHVPPKTKMVKVAGGTGRFQWHNDLAEDRVIKSLWVDVHEVTAKDYKTCMAAGVCSEPEGKALAESQPKYAEARTIQNPDRQDHPVNFVRQAQAAQYCKWAGKRLPKWDEWEWVASSGQPGRKYVWGSTASNGSGSTNYGCFYRMPLSNGLGTCAVGTNAKDTTADGVKDMGGNVHEWLAHPSVNAVHWRGENFLHASDLATIKPWLHQNFWSPHDRASVVIGFRCVRDVGASKHKKPVAGQSKPFK